MQLEVPERKNDSGVFIIAEVGINHNGDLGRAAELVGAAVDCGADAVKFQHFDVDALASRQAFLAPYQAKSGSQRKTQREMLKRYEFSVAQQQTLKSLCDSNNVEYMATAFDAGSLGTLLTDIGVSRLKIASGEITNGPLLLQHASAGLPIIMSTGMASLQEVTQALKVIRRGIPSEVRQNKGDIRGEPQRENGLQRANGRVTLLQCTTAYPASLESANLRAMEAMRREFGCPVGFSDHTTGITAAVTAAALGATVIEKHLTLSQNDEGPDHKASLEPQQFKVMIEEIGRVMTSMGSPRKIAHPSEIANINVARKSLVATQKISRGQKFTEQNLTAKRPGHGMSPMDYWELLGKISTQDYEPGDMISE